MTQPGRILRGLAAFALASASLLAAAPPDSQWNGYMGQKSFRLKLGWVGHCQAAKDLEQPGCTTSERHQASLQASVVIKLVRTPEGRGRYATWRSEEGSRPKGTAALRIVDERRGKCLDQPESWMRMTTTGGGIEDGEGRFDLDTKSGEFRVYGFASLAQGSLLMEGSNGLSQSSGTAGTVLSTASDGGEEILGTAQPGGKSLHGAPLNLPSLRMGFPCQEPLVLTWSLEPWEADEDEMLFEVGPDYDTWIPAARPEDLPGIALDASEQAWKPLIVKVRIVTKKGGNTGRSGKIRFALEDVSRNFGTCINYPRNGKPKVDLRFAKQQPEGIELKVATPGNLTGAVALAETTESVTEATVILESLDPGAYGKLKASCDALNLKALFKPTNTYALSIPRDDDGNHLADAWEKRLGIQGREAPWDQASVEGQPTLGDGLALYEKYRGAVVLAGGAKTWRRLPASEKVLFVVDEGNHFLPDAWKAASGITAFRLSRDLTEDEANPEASRTVNFNFSAVRNGHKAAVVLTEKPMGDGALVAATGRDSKGSSPVLGPLR